MDKAWTLGSADQSRDYLLLLLVSLLGAVTLLWAALFYAWPGDTLGGVIRILSAVGSVALVMLGGIAGLS